MSVTVTDVPERLRYEARVDGVQVGFAAYLRKGNLVVFTHTEVDSEHEGQGVASALAREALDDVRRRGLRALLRCPFVIRVGQPAPGVRRRARAPGGGQRHELTRP